MYIVSELLLFYVLETYDHVKISLLVTWCTHGDFIVQHSFPDATLDVARTESNKIVLNYWDTKPMMS